MTPGLAHLVTECEGQAEPFGKPGVEVLCGIAGIRVEAWRPKSFETVS